MGVVGIKIEGLRATQKKLKELPEKAREEIITASGKIAENVGGAASLRYAALGRQGPLVASTLRTAKGTVPSIKVGGSSPLGRNRKPAYKLLYGTEFGSNMYKQFGYPHTGQIGRALFPTVRDKAPYMAEEWGHAADKVLRAFEGGSASGDSEEIL